MLTEKQQQFLLNNRGLIESKPGLRDLREVALSQGLSYKEAVILVILYAEATKLYYIEILPCISIGNSNDVFIRTSLVNMGDKVDHILLDSGHCTHRPRGKEIAKLLRLTLKREFGLRFDQIPYLIKNVELGTEG